MKKALVTFLVLFAVLKSIAQPPTTQASDITIDAFTSTSLTFSWTNGIDGDAVMIVLSEGASITFPTTGISYTANSDYQLGEVISGTDDSHVVFNGVGTTTTVTNLNPSTLYHIRIYNYFVSGYIYNTGGSGTNPVTQSTACATAGTDQQVCGGSVILAGSNSSGGLGTWTIVNDGGSGSGSVDFPNSETPTFSGARGYTYILSWDVSGGGCPGYDEVQITLDADPNAPNAGGPYDQCGNSVALNGSTLTGAETGQWTVTPSGSFVDDTDPYTAFDDSGSYGVYEVTWTVTNGSCSFFDSEFVTFSQDPGPADAGTDQTICSAVLSTNLTATAPVYGTGTWTIDGGSGLNGIIQNSSSEVSQFDGVHGEVYSLTWYVQNGACSSQDQVTLFYNRPVANDTDYLQCAPGALNYDLDAHMATGGLGNMISSSYVWTASGSANGYGGGSGQVIGDLLSYTGTGDEYVDYVVTPTSIMGNCEGDPFTITVNLGQQPIVDPSLDVIIPDGGITGITLGTDGSSPVGAAGYNLMSVDASGLSYVDPGNAIPGPISSTGIYNDTYGNADVTSHDVAYYISAISALGCEGPQEQILVTVNPMPMNITDSLALVDMYNSLGGGLWSNELNWLSGPVGSWAGIAVSGGRVTEIDLNGNNLSGSIPASIGDLTQLVSLRLGNNNITGAIPDEIGLLTNLSTLFLNTTQLTSSIPASIGQLTSCLALDLSDNKLTGGIPEQIGDMTSLVSLNLSNNQLTGGIPATLANISNLQDLDLSYNQLTGSIPAALTNPNLSELYLNNNGLTGSIPAGIWTLANLEELYLNNNNLSGTIPSAIENLTGVYDIHLQNNHFSGAFPVEVVGLPNILTLNLENNEFTSVPDLTSAPLTTLTLDMNFLDFSSLEIYAGDPKYTPGNQKPNPVGDTVIVAPGDNIQLIWNAGGTTTTYQWYNVYTGLIPGATSGTLNIPDAGPNNAGAYYAIATNAALNDMTLGTTIFHVEVQSPSAGPDSDYKFVEKLGAEHMGVPQFFHEKMATSSSGVVYTFDKVTRKINKFDGNGDFVFSMDIIGTGEHQVAEVSGLDVDANDAFYVTDGINDDLLKFDASGNFVWENEFTYGKLIAIQGTSSPGSAGQGDIAFFVQVYGIVSTWYRTTGLNNTSFNIGGGAFGMDYSDFEIDPITGDWYLLKKDSSRIDRYQSNGAYEASFYTEAFGVPYGSARDIAVTENGANIYILTNEGTIVHLDNGGSFVNTFGNNGELSKPTAIAIDKNGEPLVADSDMGFVSFQNDGTFQGYKGPQKNANGQYNNPRQIAIDSKGNRYVCDYLNGRIQKTNYYGYPQFSFKLAGADSLVRPISITIDDEDNIYVADNWTSKIQKFQADGTYLQTIGGPGVDQLEFNDIRGITFGNDGFLYVTDAGNLRLQKISKAGVFDSEFNHPSFTYLGPIAFESDGALLVGNDFPSKVFRFTTGFTLVDEFDFSSLAPTISGLSTDTNGAFYVAYHDGVKKFDSNGALIANIGRHGFGDGELEFAESVSSNLSGDTVWVSAQPNRISIFAIESLMNLAVSEQDSLALKALYNATGGPTWTVNTNWLVEGAPVATWYGVNIENGLVVGIDLADNNLVGMLPDSLAALNDIQKANFSGNQLTGNLMPWLNEWVTLDSLDLSDNAFAGDIFALPLSLKAIKLDSNQFVSLTSVGDSLMYLSIAYNNLDTLGNLTGGSLTALDVSNNALNFSDLEQNLGIANFTFANQDSVGTSLQIVKQIDESETLSGDAGGSFTTYKWFKNGTEIAGETLNTLTFANLSYTDDGIYTYQAENEQLDGLVLFGRPIQLIVSTIERDAQALRALYDSTSGAGWLEQTGWDQPFTGNNWSGVVSVNEHVVSVSLPGNNLIGKIPAALSVLDYLETLDLSGNQLHGNVGPAISNLAALRHLILADNDYAGAVPPMPDSLRTLNLGGNTFNAITAVPDSLFALIMADNELDAIGDFSSSNLDILDVSGNRLTFEELEPNAGIATFLYNNQDSTGVKTSALYQVGDSETFTSAAGGVSTEYKWFKNGIEINAETLSAFTIEGITEDDDAIYHNEATNINLPGLILIGRTAEIRVSSLKRDEAALRALYTATNGDNWTNSAGWDTPLDGNVWAGVTVTNNRVTALDLQNNNLDGAVPALLADIENLETVNLSGNKLRYLAPLTSLANLTSFDVSANQLQFASLENNVGLPGLNYTNQAEIGSSETLQIHANASVGLHASVDGSNNIYQWKLNDAAVNGGNNDSLEIEMLTRGNMGKYVLEITNTIITDLVLTTAPDTVVAVSDVTGRVFATEEELATVGNVVLLRIQEGGYDTVRTEVLDEFGAYHMPGVVLGDYKLFSFVDTTEYAGALPTYYRGTIFWEEGDTVALNNPYDTFDISTQYKPLEAPTGNGMIKGVVYAPEEEGGRVKANKRVAGAGVSARKVERGGRGKEDEVVLTLIAHQFTNDQGEFELTRLPEGDYRLNIQLPGFPMDENSFIEFAIGSGPLDGQVNVEANVEGGQIVVRQLLITGIWSLEDYHVDLYPNPAASYIQIDFESESVSRSIEMYDINGRKLLNRLAQGRSEQVNVATYDRGTYILNVHDKGSIVKTIQVIIK